MHHLCEVFPHFRPRRMQRQLRFAAHMGGKSTKYLSIKLPRGGHLKVHNEFRRRKGTSAKEEEEEQVVVCSVPTQGLVLSIHNTESKRMGLLLLLSIPLTIIKKKKRKRASSSSSFSQLTFFNKLVWWSMYSTTEYNGLRDTTGLADGRRVLFIFCLQEQMVRTQ